ncbi:MAG: flagellar motor switch protein FliG [Treponema sp.]|jgi:flagellar motor switch protein FliG|nr:flagellar motor switch protein FliG [Treponema sp.]
METLRYGLDMYKQTMNIKNDAKPGAGMPMSEPGKTLIKTVKKHDEDQVKPDISAAGESKYRRVAKFLILIGSEQASEILAELDPEQVEKISREIALIKVITPEEGTEILNEFHSLFSRPYSYSGLSHGGIETARRILYASKGIEKGEAILNRAVPASRENLFSFLEDFSAGQLVMLLKNESAQTAALILSRLPAKISAETLSNIPHELKAEVLRRIAHQSEVSPEVLEQVASALKEKVRHISGRANDIEINGMETLAAILKQGDYSFGDKIINELEESSPDIGKDLKEKLYTLDDVINTVDRPIQIKLAAMSEKDIAVLIKGRRPEFCEKIMSCVSAGRRKLIREESEILGAIPKRDCDAMANEFLAWFRLARENGDIILYNDKDVFL